MCKGGFPVVVIDFRKGNGNGPFAAYEDFGVRCFEHVPDRVLLWAGEEEPDIHYTLSDVLLTVSRSVRAPLGMKLALVSPFRSVAEVGYAMQRELLEVGCELRVFETEVEALGWLDGAPALGPAPAPLHA